MTATAGPVVGPGTGSALRAELLDCVQANLALLADRLHGPGRHLALGTVLRFAPRAGDGDGALPTVEPSVEDHLRDARDLLGLAETGRWRLRPGEADVLRGHDLVYVVADAFDLPWVPYHQQRHMDHSFLVEPSAGGVTVHDAYHNDTPWGAARPGRWELDDDGLAAAVRAGALVLRLEPVDAVAGPPRQEPVAPGAVQEYLRAYREHPDRVAALDRLTLETWLLSRSRRLHAAAHDDPATFEEHLRHWESLAEQTYLAYRRVERGRAEPPGVLPRLAELLDTDRAVFDGPRRRVAAVVAGVLGVGPAEVLGGGAFTGFPSFSSFRVVEIVEGLESEFGVEFEPEDLVPENLHHLDDLCLLVGRADGGAR